MSEIERLRARLAEGTPGPWVSDERIGIVAVYSGPLRNCLSGEKFIHSAHGTWSEKGHGCWELDPQEIADAALIAAAINALPALLDVAEAAQRFRDDLARQQLRWVSDEYDLLSTALDRLEPDQRAEARLP